MTVFFSLKEQIMQKKQASLWLTYPLPQNVNSLQFYNVLLRKI